MPDDTKLNTSPKEIAYSYLKQFWVVLELTKTVVTLKTQQATDFACLMVMVNMQGIVMHCLVSWWVDADSTDSVLGSKHFREDFWGYSIKNLSLTLSNSFSIPFHTALLTSILAIQGVSIHSSVFPSLLFMALVIFPSKTDFAIPRYTKTLVAVSAKFIERFDLLTSRTVLVCRGVYYRPHLIYFTLDNG